jgi:hypothetical protein
MKTEQEIKDWLASHDFYVATIRQMEFAKLCLRQGYTEAAEVLRNGVFLHEKAPDYLITQQAIKAILNARDQIK